MPKRESGLLITDILDSIETIFQYVEGLSFEAFSGDRKTIDATVRNFEIIGEASKLVDEHLKNRYQLVEWRMMKDFRNILIHQYFGVDKEALWKAIKESLPYNYDLLKQIKI